MSLARTNSRTYDGAMTSRMRLRFHSALVRPSPVISPPAACPLCHISRLLDDSSKKPFTMTGRPVRIGRGRKQYARPTLSAMLPPLPLVLFDTIVEEEEGEDRGQLMQDATPPQGISRNRALAGSSAIILQDPPPN